MDSGGGINDRGVPAGGVIIKAHALHGMWRNVYDSQLWLGTTGTTSLRIRTANGCAATRVGGANENIAYMLRAITEIRRHRRTTSVLFTSNPND